MTVGYCGYCDLTLDSVIVEDHGPGWTRITCPLCGQSGTTVEARNNDTKGTA